MDIIQISLHSSTNLDSRSTKASKEDFPETTKTLVVLIMINLMVEAMVFQLINNNQIILHQICHLEDLGHQEIINHSIIKLPQTTNKEDPETNQTVDIKVHHLQITVMEDMVVLETNQSIRVNHKILEEILLEAIISNPNHLMVVAVVPIHMVNLVYVNIF